MNYIDYFMDARKPLIRPRPVVVEEDYQLVCDVFPEPGFRSYFFGYIISKLAADLRKHGITNYIERESRPEFPSLTGFLSDIVIIREESFTDERRGTRGAYETNTGSEGKSSNTPKPTCRKAEDGEKGKRREEA